MSRLIYLLCKASLLFASLWALSGCGAVLAGYARLQHSENPPEPTIGHDPFSQDIASRFGFMAFLADNVYNRGILAGESHCRPPKEQDGLLLLNKARSRSAKGGWERPANTEGVNFCLDHPSGLFYETFVFRNQSHEIDEAVIVFRGTEGLNLRDWGANLSVSIGVEPQQYRVVLSEIEPVIDELKRISSAELSIYSVGHSLGGGLAQQAGYRFAEINTVYAFNPSPVTNWTWLVLKHGGPRQDWPVIYRVYHTGEALHHARNFTVPFLSTKFNRYDIGLQLTRKSTISGHAMAVISCGLADIITEAGLVMNSHSYTLEEARAVRSRCLEPLPLN
ncbi:DUF6792 domain-containing protein [Roseinatronobacter sp.]